MSCKQVNTNLLWRRCLFTENYFIIQILQPVEQFDTCFNCLHFLWTLFFSQIKLTKKTKCLGSIDLRGGRRMFFTRPLPSIPLPWLNHHCSRQFSRRSFYADKAPRKGIFFIRADWKELTYNARNVVITEMKLLLLSLFLPNLCTKVILWAKTRPNSPGMYVNRKTVKGKCKSREQSVTPKHLRSQPGWSTLCLKLSKHFFFDFWRVIDL